MSIFKIQGLIRIMVSTSITSGEIIIVMILTFQIYAHGI